MAEHPITPTPELVLQWIEEHYGAVCIAPGMMEATSHIATQAAQWGADQELEACVKWIDNQTLVYHRDFEHALLTARRPKPPSLKELALARTDAILNNPNHALLTEVRETLELNRRALEELPE